jgi:hypothetical protein
MAGLEPRRKLRMEHAVISVSNEEGASESDGLTFGATSMSITEARKPRPRRLLDGFPPDTRIVVAGVTWEDYDRFSRAVREGESCRVAFDGKDIERRFADEAVAIEWLAPDGSYVAAASSRFLHVRPEEVARWVFAEESPRSLAWEQRLREWVREELVPRATA